MKLYKHVQGTSDTTLIRKVMSSMNGTVLKFYNFAQVKSVLCLFWYIAVSIYLVCNSLR